MIRSTAFSLTLMMPFSAHALDLAMPQGSVLTVDTVVESGSYALPDAPFTDGRLSSRQITGFMSQQVWQLEGDLLSTAQLIDPLRSQVQAAGYSVLLDCDSASCGGFDFRFATEVLPAPDMFVDLIDYRFLSAVRETGDGLEALSVLTSRTKTAGLTQLIAVQPGPSDIQLPLAKPDGISGNTALGSIGAGLPSDLAKSLEVGGHVILSDLSFETGSSNLSETTFESLQALATYLLAAPERRIALVGHTDNVGALENNQALSEKRARAVRDRLIKTHGVTASQLEAQGVGYLAPIASNLTDAGRTANRRVEAVILDK